MTYEQAINAAKWAAIDGRTTTYVYQVGINAIQEAKFTYSRSTEISGVLVARFDSNGVSF